MSNRIPALFNKSLIAAAVVSLSACSTTPRVEDYDLSRVGEGILTAGRVTADVTERVWSKTSYLLGFSDSDADGNRDSDAETRSDEGLLMDAEEVALLENGTTAPRDTTIRPIVIRSAIPTRPQDQTPTYDELAGSSQAADFETPTYDELAESGQAADFETSTYDELAESGQAADFETPTYDELAESGQAADFETPIKPDSDNLTQTAINTESTGTQTESTPLTEDLVHKVAASETLWDIAKMTTGDANNWHVLADVNNLGPNASVFPGDLLIIPADMINPSTGASSAPETSSQLAPEQIFVDTQNLTGASKSQALSADAQPQLEPTAIQAELSDSQVNPQIGGKAFKLDPGETLWDLAKRSTGDATNWKAIAGQNNFSTTQAALVRTGQTIYVPEELIKPDLDSASFTAKPDMDSAANDNPSDLDTSQETIQTAADTTGATVEPAPVKAEVLRTLTISSASTLAGAARDTDLLNVGLDPLSESSAAIDPGQSMKIVEATFKSDEVVPPLSHATDAVISASANTLSPEQIMVNGTYYPKAIYNNADFSSSLLMRVSPGTTLQVSKAMGNWYQVKTSKGLGYVHQRDIK